MTLRAITLVSAIGLAASATTALAQSGTGEKAGGGAAASKPPSVGGVVVEAPPKTKGIPPDKKAAFDAEAAKRETWKTYRETAAPPTPAATAPATESAAARAENYPGLHSLPE